MSIQLCKGREGKVASRETTQPPSHTHTRYLNYTSVSFPGVYRQHDRAAPVPNPAPAPVALRSSRLSTPRQHCQRPGRNALHERDTPPTLPACSSPRSSPPPEEMLLPTSALPFAPPHRVCAPRAAQSSSPRAGRGSPPLRAASRSTAVSPPLSAPPRWSRQPEPRQRLQYPRLALFASSLSGTSPEHPRSGAEQRAVFHGSTLQPWLAAWHPSRA